MADATDAIVNGLDQTISDLETRLKAAGPDLATEKTLKALREQREKYPRGRAAASPRLAAHTDPPDRNGIVWATSTHSAYTPKGELISIDGRSCVSVTILTR